MKRIVVSLLLLSVFSSPAVAEVVTRFQRVPGTSDLGDLWTFSCPSGGTVDITVNNGSDGVGGSALDLMMTVRDGDGMVVGSGDDEFACTNASACFACPQDLGIPCGSGGTFSVAVRGVDNCALTPGLGAGYQLDLEVRDSQGVALSAKQAKLGGGAKVKAPGWLGAVTAPAIDDGKVTN